MGTWSLVETARQKIVSVSCVSRELATRASSLHWASQTSKLQCDFPSSKTIL